MNKKTITEFGFVRRSEKLRFQYQWMDNIHHLDLHNSSRHTQPYSNIAKIELGLCYNSCQYQSPLCFASILQMQLKDP